MTKTAKIGFSAKEKAFADELAKHENEWVAIFREGKAERIVASGRTIIDAKRDAEARGFTSAVYLKVPSSTKVFIA